MNNEERYKNTLAALTALLATANARDAERTNTQQARQGEMEERSKMLTKLLVRTNERKNIQPDWINKLKEARVQREEAFTSLIEAQQRTAEALASLTVRVDKLADTVQKHIEDGNEKA